MYLSCIVILTVQLWVFSWISKLSHETISSRYPCTGSVPKPSNLNSEIFYTWNFSGLSCDTVSAEFHMWPHGTSLSQDAGALKILYGRTFGLFAWSVRETEMNFILRCGLLKYLIYASSRIMKRILKIQVSNGLSCQVIDTQTVL